MVGQMAVGMAAWLGSMWADRMAERMVVSKAGSMVAAKVGWMAAMTVEQ